MRHKRQVHKKRVGETLVIDEFNHISRKRGNDQLRRQVWIDKAGKVTRYNLAYINHQLYQQDNGRVIGYDNAHGYHHRHYFGTIKTINFTSFEDIEERFQNEWRQLNDNG